MICRFQRIQSSKKFIRDRAFIVTDHALYRFHADAAGVPQQDWRTPYDRGTDVKPGNINQGSGTTPKLFGEMVAIADNAEPRIHVMFETS